MRIIDAHTHIFPDKIAEKATVATAEYFVLPEPPNHYGHVQELLDVLNEAGIEYSLVFSAATKANQVESINRYIRKTLVKRGAEIVKFFKCFIFCSRNSAG